MSPWPLLYPPPKYTPVRPKLDINIHTYDYALETYYLVSIFIIEGAA